MHRFPPAIGMGRGCRVNESQIQDSSFLGDVPKLDETASDGLKRWVEDLVIDTSPIAVRRSIRCESGVVRSNH